MSSAATRTGDGVARKAERRLRVWPACGKSGSVDEGAASVYGGVSVESVEMSAESAVEAEGRIKWRSGVGLQGGWGTSAS